MGRSLCDDESGSQRDAAALGHLLGLGDGAYRSLCDPDRAGSCERGCRFKGSCQGEGFGEGGKVDFCTEGSQSGWTDDERSEVVEKEACRRQNGDADDCAEDNVQDPSSG